MWYIFVFGIVIRYFKNRIIIIEEVDPILYLVRIVLIIKIYLNKIKQNNYKGCIKIYFVLHFLK